MVSVVNNPVFVAKQRQARRFAGTADRTAKPLQVSLTRLLRQIGRRQINQAVRRGDLKQPIQKAISQADELEMLRLIRTFGVRRVNQAGRQTAERLQGEWLFRPTVVEDFLELSEIKIREYLQDANVEVANRVREVLVQSQRQLDQTGTRMTIDQMTNELEKKLLDTGAFSAARAERIARTETATAQTFGIHQGMKVSGFDRKEWVAILDNRVRPLHADMNGAVVGIDEPFVLGDGTKMMFPGDPTAPAKHRVNCVAGNTVVSGPSIKKVYRRPYGGDLLTVRTLGGHKLSGTPNHPILTPKGWVALGALRQGDHVISCVGGQRLTIDHHHVDHHPIPIEQVFDLAQVAGITGSKVRGRGFDFHGDGSEAEIDVVSVDRELRGHGEPTIIEHLLELALPFADMLERLLSCFSSLNQFGLSPLGPAHSIVGGPNELGSAFGALALHSDAVGFGATPRGDAGPDETIADGSTSNPKEIRKLLHAFASPVTTDQIINVDVSSSEGHIYNLETNEGWYIGNGIVQHNCRCQLVVPRIGGGNS